MPNIANSPCGRLVPTIEGQRAFVPNPLPRELALSSGLVSLLDRASSAVGRLSGVGETVPNPHLIIQPFIRREAVLSSRIEGTISSISDVFTYEAVRVRSAEGDVEEVVNYVVALEYGIERLDSLPISLRLLNELHQRLLTDVRGEEKRPGEIRPEQVWIGSPGSPIEDARFIPPPPDYLRDLVYDWERFANDSEDMPPLVRCALMHYQIEAIHPYHDGNGRIGRLMIVLFLCASGVLPTPLLYMSAYFERDRQRYYDELLNVSVTGDWERWISYFLQGVYQESQDALARIRRIRDLQDEYRDLLQNRRETANGFRLLESLFANPFTTVAETSDLLDITDPGARQVLNRLVEAGIVQRIDTTWPNQYVADRLLEEIERPIARQDS